MQTIYILFINRQTSDSDDWYRYVEANVISYHASEAGARAKMAKLIGEQVELLKTSASKPENADYSEYYSRLLAEMEANMGSFEEGTEGKQVKKPIYFVQPIQLEE